MIFSCLCALFWRSLFVLFLLAIVLSVSLLFTDSRYPLWYLQTLLIVCKHVLRHCVTSVTREKNIHVIIKLQMYVLLYKNKHITKKVEMVKNFEGYS
jgi:hypothetical protein